LFQEVYYGKSYNDFILEYCVLPYVLRTIPTRVDSYRIQREGNIEITSDNRRLGWVTEAIEADWPGGTVGKVLLCRRAEPCKLKILIIKLK